VKRGRRGRRSAHRVVDAVWLLWPANVKLDAQHLATEDQEGFYEDEHPAYGHLEPRPPLGYQPVDLRDFDSPLGTEAELESLIGTLHDHGIFVVLDAVLDHMANPRAPTDRWGDADDPLDETHQDWPQFETEEHFTEIPEFGYERPAEEFEDPPFDRSLLKLPSLDVRHPKYGKLTRRTSGRRSGSVPTASGSTPPSTSGRGTGGT
jgi:alpha-amylase